MAQATDPPNVTNKDLYAEIYGVICDAVERAWHNWPVERGADEAPVMHTSAYARAAANRVMEALGELRDEDTRTHDELVAAECEYFDRVWYTRAKADSAPTAEVTSRMREVEASRAGLDVTDDFALGVLHGKLSALRWTLGEEWDNYDT